MHLDLPVPLEDTFIDVEKAAMPMLLATVGNSRHCLFQKELL